MTDTSAPPAVSKEYIVPDFACRPPVSVDTRLRSVDGSKKLITFNFADRKEATFVLFGRELQCDFVVSHASVSRKHAVLQYGNGPEGPGWYLFDLGTPHGTWVDRERIPDKEYRLVDDGAVIALGEANQLIKLAIQRVDPTENDAAQTKISYSLPSWRLPVPPELNYSLEVIDKGTVERMVPLRGVLKDDCYITLGSNADFSVIKDAHPSVSRLHAVLQFGLLSGKYGWFIYDNDSTHGTKLNRRKLPKHYFARIPIGGSFTMGQSTKIYSIAGVSHEEEEEVASKVLAAQKKADKVDVVEDSAPKPWASDPVGWLTSWYETEGLSLDFNFTPSGANTTICSIDLRAALNLEDEMIVKGEGRGRDDARKKASLAACECISKQSAMSTVYEFRTKQQEYEENDYYSSDEDEYLDRTGQLEEKRKKRRERFAKQEGQEPAALTYDSLCKQLAEAKESLKAVSLAHQEISDEARSTKSQSAKFKVSNSRQKLAAAEAEIKRLEVLVNAAKPVDVAKHFSKPSASSSNAVETKSVPSNSLKVVKEKEEIAQDEVEPKLRGPVMPTSTMKETEETAEGPVELKLKGPAMPPFTEAGPAETDGFKVPDLPARGPKRPNDDATDESTTPIDPVEEKPKKPTGFGLIHRKDLQDLKNRALIAKKRKIMDLEDEFMEDEEVPERDAKTEIVDEHEDKWTPPVGQTGDGKTELNAKFGY